MTQDIIDRIEGLAEKATARPWHVKSETDIETSLDGDERYCEWMAEITAKHEDHTEYLSLLIQSCGLHRFAKPNADFIVALVNAWPAIRDRLRAAEAVCEAVHYFAGDESNLSSGRANTPERIWEPYVSWRRLREGSK